MRKEIFFGIQQARKVAGGNAKLFGEQYSIYVYDAGMTWQGYYTTARGDGELHGATKCETVQPPNKANECAA